MPDETYYPPPSYEDAIQEVIKETGAHRAIVEDVITKYGGLGSQMGWILLHKPKILKEVRIRIAAEGSSPPAALVTIVVLTAAMATMQLTRR